MDLCLKEDYDAVPVLAIVEPDDDRITEYVEVDQPTVDRIKAVIKAYWAVQYELRTMVELAEQTKSVEETKAKLQSLREDNDECVLSGLRVLKLSEEGMSNV